MEQTKKQSIHRRSRVYFKPQKPQADNWDGPHYRPFLCVERRHGPSEADHLLALNALEPEGCWLYTLEGFGVYRCDGDRYVLDVGQALSYHSPDRGALHLDLGGLPWRYLCIHVVGEPAVTMFDFILERLGMFQPLPATCAAVRLAAKLVRLTLEQPHRDAHFWSQHTFAWLDALWQCSEKYAVARQAVQLEAPRTAEALPSSINSVGKLAKQLGYSQAYLTRKLRVQWGKPPGTVMRLRMERAASLLRTTKLSVGEIAAKLGMTGPAVFARAFKRSFGMTTLAYHRRANSGLRLPALRY